MKLKLMLLEYGISSFNKSDLQMARCAFLFYNHLAFDQWLILCSLLKRTAIWAETMPFFLGCDILSTQIYHRGLSVFLWMDWRLTARISPYSIATNIQLSICTQTLLWIIEILESKSTLKSDEFILSSECCTWIHAGELFCEMYSRLVLIHALMMNVI